MTHYETYTLILCILVFFMLAFVLGALFLALIRLTLKAIRAGIEDDTIKKEYKEALAKSRRARICERTVAIALSCIFLMLFAFSLYVNIQGDVFFEKIPTIKLVESGSMAEKHGKNTYLFKNELDNQIGLFDLIFVYAPPSEEELALYDVVVYEEGDSFIVHRIIAIEEPNDNHPTERYFLCRGDANENSDRFPVRYSQIRAIWRGARIPFVGSFISFLQSPAGWLCLFFVLIAVIGMPIAEKKLDEEKKARLREIGYIDDEGSLTED